MPGRDHNDIWTSDTVVELAGVSKTFRQRKTSSRWQDVGRNLLRPEWLDIHALKDVDFTICRGEFVAYAGQNGDGKSSMVKRQDENHYTASGPVRARDITLVFVTILHSCRDIV